MFRRTQWIGIDIGSGHVKVVALQRRFGKLQVAGVGCAGLPESKDGGPPSDTAPMARAIRNALDVAGVRRLRAKCGLPRHAAAIRLVRLPGQPSERLAQAALLEAARTLPFSSRETESGAHLQHDPETDQTLALVAAARTDLVDAYRAALSAAGVRLEGLGVSGLAAAAACEAPDQPWVLMDIGAYATTLDVFAKGTVRTSRVFLMGGEHLTQAFAKDLGCDAETAEERKRAVGLMASNENGEGAAAGGIDSAVEAWFSQLVSEAHLLLAAHTAQGGTAPAVARLVGGGGALPGLAPRLERMLGVMVEPLPVGPLREAGVDNPLQYAAAYGLAQAAAGRTQIVDLIAAELAEGRKARRRRTRAWAAAASCLLVLGTAGSFGHQAWQTHQDATRERAAIARQVATSQSAVRSLTTRQQTLTSHAEGLRSALKPRHAWVDVLNELAGLAPQGIWLTGAELERGKPLVIRGTAMRPQQAADFVTALSRSPLLDEVRLSFANDAELGRQRVTQFGITAQVRGNLPEARPKAPAARTTATPRVARTENTE